MLYVVSAAAAVSLVSAGMAWADPCAAIPDRGPMPAGLHKGATFSGPVVYVGDGDSLCVDVRPGPFDFGPKGASWVEVRLADFYAPELHEAAGPVARAMLEHLVMERRLTCVANHRSYDRIVARCALAGVSVGDRLRQAGAVEGGGAWRRR